MALMCYNKGCGVKFDANQNKDDSCLFHPGVPIFHDALKGWSCCRKRTTDFSEFLSIKGCTRGRHSNEKPQEPLRPEVSSDKGEIKQTNGPEIIYQGPKSAEKLQKERPSSDEPKIKLPQKVSPSLTQVLEKLDLNKKAEEQKKGLSRPGDERRRLRPPPRSSRLPRGDKKKVACRHDWHQTGNNVVVTVYAKNPNPELCSIEANRTVLACQIQFEDNKIFKREFHLWGVMDVKHSSVNMVPSKVEITLRKADQVAWGKLEDPNYKPEPEPVDDIEPTEEIKPDWDIDDDDISDSDDEWAYDPRRQKTEEEKAKDEERKKEEVAQKRKEVEEDMRRAMEERKKAEEEKKQLAEQRKQEEQEGGFEDMPELEDI
ncbi:Cysteine and histidine-rich domain-containing protein 1 CHORD domain-containing protein 1 [Collichthys lucidus]|uniref:Cysteine and histidine-rich domain-containing protein 1 CHORD domain-containing protein 1 n=1 Tax=Collichthys lucidus TaxID=240159 RepID=A0A4U5VY74_COLLU|nr:Cysteine and histidine-rich domain-containing protein 1 CHORD domain-containing protein 1 [Collichthys lucidus]